MPAPIAPVAMIALRYAAVAATAYAVARYAEQAPRNQKAEDVLDETPEGLSMSRDEEALRASGKMTRTVRLGRSGPGVEIELTGLGRLRLRRT